MIEKVYDESEDIVDDDDMEDKDDATVDYDDQDPEDIPIDE